MTEAYVRILQAGGQVTGTAVVAPVPPVSRIVAAGPKGDPGDDGAVGPQGPAGAAASRVRHVQLAAEAVWEITHNLGLNPDVSTFDSAGRLIYGEVDTTTSATTCTITFSAPVSGVATLRL